MVRIATFFKWAIVALWTAVALPVLIDLFKKWLDRNGAFDHPENWAMNGLASVAQIPGVYPAALLLTGLLAGAWIDWLLRKFDGQRTRKRHQLGEEFKVLARHLSGKVNSFHGEWPVCVHDYRPRLMSAFINAESFGIWAPVNELYERADGAAIMINYLSIVGTMLSDGHFKQAKLRAKQARQFMEGTSNATRS
jgi:hypothetical protein